MRERNHNEVSLPDHTVGGVSLSDGKLVGLTNLSRAGVAVLDERPEKIYLTFTMELADLQASYLWTRKKIGGNLSTVMGKVSIKIKIRQEKQRDRDDCLDIVEFLVGDLQDMTVDLQGLGLLNWVVKKVILGVVEQNISTILVTRGKELFRKEISEISLIDQMYTTFTIL